MKCWRLLLLLGGVLCVLLAAGRGALAQGCSDCGPTCGGCVCGCGPGGNTAAGIGARGPFLSSNVELLAHLTLEEIGGTGANILGNDVWGWTDAATGKEYAIYGRTDGTAFVDVSDPRAPLYLGKLPSATGISVWRDMEVYKDHVFVVSDANGAHGMQIFDLKNLRAVASPPATFAETARYRGFTRAPSWTLPTRAICSCCREHPTRARATPIRAG